MIIQHNLTAMNAQRSGMINQRRLKTSAEKLSSGYRINRSADDAAGLSISEKMRWQIRGLNQAGRNIQDGISLIQTAEGALGEMHSILQRMNELSIQAANDTNTDIDRGQIQSELDALQEEIDRIADHTEFNTKKLLGGSVNGAGGFSQGDVFTYDFSGLKNNLLPETIRIEVGGIGFSPNSNNPTAPNPFLVGNTIEGTMRNLIAAMQGSELGAAFDIQLDTANGMTVTMTAKRDQAPNGTVLTPGYWVVTTRDSNTNPGALEWSNVLPDAKAADGSPLERGLKIQAGTQKGQVIAIEIPDMHTDAIGVFGIIVDTHDDAAASAEEVQRAIEFVSSVRSDLGAMQNRLETAMRSVTVTSENTSASESRIRDTDMAQQMMEQAKLQILSQSVQAVLSQANQQPAGILSLLG